LVEERKTDKKGYLTPPRTEKKGHPVEGGSMRRTVGKEGRHRWIEGGSLGKGKPKQKTDWGTEGWGVTKKTGRTQKKGGGRLSAIFVSGKRNRVRKHQLSQQGVRKRKRFKFFQEEEGVGQGLRERNEFRLGKGGGGKTRILGDRKHGRRRKKKKKT